MSENKFGSLEDLVKKLSKGTVQERFMMAISI